MILCCNSTPIFFDVASRSAPTPQLPLCSILLTYNSVVLCTKAGIVYNRAAKAIGS